MVEIWGKQTDKNEEIHSAFQCKLLWKIMHFDHKYTISSSTTSKWAITLILYHFEVLMRATQPPNMKVKLHLEVVELDIDFSGPLLNLFSVFIT